MDAPSTASLLHTWRSLRDGEGSPDLPKGKAQRGVEQTHACQGFLCLLNLPGQCQGRRVPFRKATTEGSQAVTAAIFWLRPVSDGGSHLRVIVSASWMSGNFPTPNSEA